MYTSVQNETTMEQATSKIFLLPVACYLLPAACFMMLPCLAYTQTVKIEAN
jgi:hypothetical protein